MNRSEQVRAVIWLDQLAAKAKAEAAKLREALAADAKAELAEHGLGVTWRWPDIATVIGSVTHKAVYVADEKAFTAWMAERYPTEVETVQRIRPAWLPGFLARLEVEHNTIEADHIAVDPGTGEWPPGLAVKPGGEFGGITIRPTAAVKEVLGALAEHGLRRLAAEASPETPVVLAVAGADA